MLDDALNIVNAANVKGAVLNDPLQKVLFETVDYCSTTGEALGCIDTISKDSFSDTHGENLGCKAMKSVIEYSQKKHLGNTNGLVIGTNALAVATCYAFRKLGINVLVYSNNKEDAEVLALKFNGKHIEDMKDIPKLSVVAYTLETEDIKFLDFDTLDEELLVFDPFNKHPIRDGDIYISTLEFNIIQAIYQFDKVSKWIAKAVVLSTPNEVFIKGLQDSSLLDLNSTSQGFNEWISNHN